MHDDYMLNKYVVSNQNFIIRSQGLIESIGAKSVTEILFLIVAYLVFNP